MNKILLASHGQFAIGLKNTLEIFLGPSDRIVAVGAYMDSSSDYMHELQQFIDTAKEDESIIFTDIYGGSVNQQVTRMVLESNKAIPIITSMNLPIVLSIALANQALSSSFINQTISECIPQLIQLKMEEEKEGDLGEFFQ